MSRVVSMFGSKVYRDIGHTFGLIFSVHGPRGSWAVNTFSLGYLDDFHVI